MYLEYFFIITLAVFTISGFFLGVLYMLYPLNGSQNSSTLEAQAAKREPWHTSYTTCNLDPNSTDRTPPTVRITNPLNGGTIPKGDGTANVRIEAVASDNLPLGNGDTKSSFYVNGVVKDIMPYELINNDTPYDFYWGAPKSILGKTYSFQVKICDAAGNEAWSPIIKVTTAR